jgi:hypothetical protein
MRRAILLGLAFLPASAVADEVFVRGGGRLVGEVVERGSDSIVVDIGVGRIGLPLSAIERVVPGATPLSVYRSRAARLGPRDAAGWLALGLWAREQDLDTNAREAFEHVLAIDPRNAGAHRALGHVLAGGRWMTVEQSHRARGDVRFEGRWMAPEEREAVLAERTAAAVETRVRAEAEARIAEAHARARVAEAEARRAEAEVARADPGPWRDPWVGWGFTPWLVTAFPSGFHPRRHGFARGFSTSRRFHRSLGRRPFVPGIGRGAGFVTLPPPPFRPHDTRRRHRSSR